VHAPDNQQAPVGCRPCEQMPVGKQLASEQFIEWTGNSSLRMDLDG